MTAAFKEVTPEDIKYCFEKRGFPADDYVDHYLVIIFSAGPMIVVIKSFKYILINKNLSELFF